MLTQTPIYRKVRFWLITIPLILTVVWFILFYKDLSVTFLWMFKPDQLVVRGIESIQLRESIAFSLLAILAYPVYVLLYLWMMSQFILPIKLPSERIKVFRRLLLFITGGHGPAIFVKEGDIKGSLKELQSSRPGVAFVDLTSAIVMERLTFAPPTAMSTAAAERRRRARVSQGDPGKPLQLETPMVRTAGPGVVFTEAGEKIRGVVSLRRQVRIKTNVNSITRDGFEVTAPIVTIFSLGDQPEILRLGYFGDQASDIKVIQLDDKNEFVRGSRDELDDDDQFEVHRYYQSHSQYQDEDSDELLVNPVTDKSHSPYIYDPERVFKAVYADAHRTSDDMVESWLDLPTKVAVEIYHNLISSYRYTDLYQPKEETSFPFNEVFKPELARRVRNQGVLAFQLVVRKDGMFFAEGQEWNPDQLEIYPARYFNTSKVLRDRGIRVITATLPELRPVNPAVRRQLLEYWRAQWQREADLHMAPYDYQEIKVRAAARVQAQKDIVKSLFEVLQDSSITPEITVMRLFQALETFAKEPATHKLLSGDTLNMLTKLQTWATEPPKLSLPEGAVSQDQSSGQVGSI